MTSQNGEFRFFVKCAKLVTSPWAAGVVSTSGFLFPLGYHRNPRRIEAIFLETTTSGTVSTRKSSGREFARLWPFVFVTRQRLALELVTQITFIFCS